MSDIELQADAYADTQDELRHIRREEEIEANMAELGCSRIVAEIMYEQAVGANPDAYYPA